jgi:DNA-binding response OmpR family regulator
VPVIVLTARNAAEDRIRGLDPGVDDYVTKPFSPAEVVLRVQAVPWPASADSAAVTCSAAVREDVARHGPVLDRLAGVIRRGQERGESDATHAVRHSFLRLFGIPDDPDSGERWLAGAPG